MRRYFGYLMIWSYLATFTLFAQAVVAVPACFCATKVDAAAADAKCVESTAPTCPGLPEGANTRAEYGKYSCEWKTDAATCNQAKKTWDDQRAVALKNEATAGQAGPGSGRSAFASLSTCGEQTTVSGQCADVSIFVILLIDIARYGFSIIGALALLFFIYGGFMMIISGGNSEKVEQGRNAMVAAVLGLVVAMGGYLLIRSLGELVGLKPDFRLK